MAMKLDLNRRTAYYTLVRIQRDETYSNLELNNQIERSQPDAPWFVRELVYCVLRNQDYLDYMLRQMIARGFGKLKAEPLTLLRMGLAQILFLDSVTDYAAVDETVKLAKQYCKYQAGLINGVLRNYLREPGKIKRPEGIKGNALKRMATEYSMDPSIVELWRDQYGDEKAESLLAACNTPAPLTVRVNRRVTDVEALTASLEARGIEAGRTELSDRILTLKGRDILSSEEYEKGMFTVQGAGSICSIEELDVEPGMTVVDVCAAPGGKSLACAEFMENQGRVISMDINENKLNELKRQSERLDLTIIETRQHDGTQIREDLVGSCDRVICDVPCSGLGVLRRKPEIKHRPLANEGADLAEKQYQILQASANYLKEEGILVYSTCTINFLENGDVVDRFLEEHPEFQMLSERQFMPDTDGVDGFYYCKMKKN